MSAPSPPCAITSSAVLAAMKSSSLAIDVPPGLTALNRISSSLYVVGLRTTRAPFDRRHSVTPIAARDVSLATVPGRGKRGEQRCGVDAYRRTPASVAVARALDGRRQRLLRGHGPSGGRRAGDGDDAVAVGRPRLGEPVDLFERDLRQETLCQGVLVDDARNRFVVHEVADVFVGQRRGWALVPFDDRPFEVLRAARLLPVQLGLRETDSGRRGPSPRGAP